MNLRLIIKARAAISSLHVHDLSTTVTLNHVNNILIIIYALNNEYYIYPIDICIIDSIEICDLFIEYG